MRAGEDDPAVDLGGAVPDRLDADVAAAGALGDRGRVACRGADPGRAVGPVAVIAGRQLAVPEQVAGGVELREATELPQPTNRCPPGSRWALPCELAISPSGCWTELTSVAVLAFVSSLTSITREAGRAGRRRSTVVEDADRVRALRQGVVLAGELDAGAEL